MGPTGEHRILQIHPTRQCNLSCLHCYSASSPEQRGRLAATLLADAIDTAADAGYTRVSFSGGEPVLYEQLPALLTLAKSHGMGTTVTSNGTILTASRLERLRENLDVLAISLDGVPESHNRMRSSDSAFERMHHNLHTVRDFGIPFGFIFTLTQYNLHELEWVAKFALEQGAVLLQIHPLTATGNANTRLPDEIPDQRESAFAWIMARRLTDFCGDALRIQVDVHLSKQIKDNPDHYFADVASDTKVPFSEVLSPLIIEADGEVVPIQYGFPRHFSLGNLHNASLAELFTEWTEGVRPKFMTLCHSVYQEVADSKQNHFLNWYGLLQKRAEAIAGSDSVYKASA